MTPGISSVQDQAPLSTGISRQAYWSRLPFPAPRDLPNPGIKLLSPALQAYSLPSEPPGKSNIIHRFLTAGGLVPLTPVFVKSQFICLYRHEINDSNDTRDGLTN